MKERGKGERGDDRRNGRKEREREGGRKGGTDSVNISVQQREDGNTCIHCQPLRAEEMGKTGKQETRGSWEKCL